MKSTICSEFFGDQEKLFKNPGFSLVENRLDQTEKQWFRECYPESPDSDKLYYNLFVDHESLIMTRDSRVEN